MSNGVTTAANALEGKPLPSPTLTLPGGFVDAAQTSTPEIEAPAENGVDGPGEHLLDADGSSPETSARESNPIASTSSIDPSSISPLAPSHTPPSIHKRKLKGRPKGILKTAPPPSKAFSFRRDILQQVNTRLAQQGVNVQVPVPQGSSTLVSLSDTAQGTAQAAGHIIGGMFKRMGGYAAGSPGPANHSVHADRLIPPSPNSPEQRRHSEQSKSDLSSIASTTTTQSNNLPQPSPSIRPLRKVSFTVSDISVIYPISNAIAPGDEDATRIRVEREHREKMSKKSPLDWTPSELEKLYRECCRIREEHPLKKMRSIFQEASQNQPPLLKTLDLSFVWLDRHALEPLADLLSIDFGLNKLVLENSNLTDDGIKSILHALLVSGTLPSLSIASNKKIKYHGWRYVGIFMRRARALKYLDLSENNLNKASLEHIAAAIARHEDDDKSRPSEAHKDGDDDEDNILRKSAELLREETKTVSSLSSLRLENCGLRTASLEFLAQSVRFSTLNHLSLRRNRISQMAAVALAVMLKDYPDATPLQELDVGSTSLEQAQQHSPYVVRSASARDRHSPTLPDVPLIVSSPGGGVTRRERPLDGALQSQQSAAPDASPARLPSASMADVGLGDSRQSEEEALALYQAKRAKRILASMPRIGSLLTLDLKGNDIRGGVVYLSQALRKNRTLKVLNLSDNNIEMAGLTAIAEALKYNSTLETLDLSHNPCSGPGLQGITTLRNAFTLNSNLKRLFLSDTDLSSEGAIALAEFLPEAKSLIHLDLTENLQIDIAGVMALAVSVKMNKALRCLDLNIPPNSPDFARLSQDLLNSCIRNTEMAQRKAQQRGVKMPIAAPIYKSTLARAAKEKEESARSTEANTQLDLHAKQQATESHDAICKRSGDTSIEMPMALNV